MERLQGIGVNSKNTGMTQAIHRLVVIVTRLKILVDIVSCVGQVETIVD